MVMLLSACSTSGADSFCLVAKPIIVDRARDSLTVSTARQILTHNERGAEICGWRDVHG